MTVAVDDVNIDVLRLLCVHLKLETRVLAVLFEVQAHYARGDCYIETVGEGQYQDQHQGSHYL